VPLEFDIEQGEFMPPALVHLSINLDRWVNPGGLSLRPPFHHDPYLSIR
jgi:hypothetical protein